MNILLIIAVVTIIATIVIWLIGYALMSIHELQENFELPPEDERF